MDHFDVCIVGAGVVGLAIARQLSGLDAMRNRSIVILEQEKGFGYHTSSRNSEVIHAGIYYQPGSLKAVMCVRGKQLLYEHCQAHHIPYHRIGKLILAQAGQSEQLQVLADNAAANGVKDLRWISQAELQAEEPAVRAASALLSPSTGILDSHSYMQSLLHQSQNQGVEFAPFTSLEAIEWQANRFTVTCSIKSRAGGERYQFHASALVNCAGLQAAAIADRLITPRPQLVPTIHFCKGDYFNYISRSPLKHLVYPMPESHTTGLGIHATLDLAGQLRFGPDTEFIDTIHYAIDPGKAQAFAHAIQRYLPSITPEKLQPAYAGIRPKLAPAGSPAQDFQVQTGTDSGIPGLVQLFGIESPGLTASLALGEYVSDRVIDLLG